MKNDAIIEYRIANKTGATSVTQERLIALLRYNPETGLFAWLVSRGRTAKAGGVAGGLDKEGYHVIKIDGREYKAHRLAWLYVHGAWPSAEIDHVNRDRADNRWSNLREATETQNSANRSMSSRNTSGVKGACWNKARGKWMGYIMSNGSRRHLGYFTNLEDASAAYAAAARDAWGEFAHPAA